MSTELKAPIQLSQPNDWLQWSRYIRLMAEAKGVWDYIDPSLPREPALPHRPTRPSPNDIQPGARTLIDLEPSNRELYRDSIRDFEARAKEHQVISTGVSTLLLVIINSISYNNRQATLSAESPYQILRILSAKLAPTNESRKRDLIKRYTRLRAPPTGSIESHISAWENLYTEALGLEIPEVQNPIRPLFDFLESISSASPTFSALWQDKLLEKSENNDVIPPFYEMTKRFRDYTRLNQSNQPRNPRSKIAAATLQGLSDSSPTDSTNQNSQIGQNSRSPTSRKRLCPCLSDPDRGDHLFNRCPYINDSIRPSGWSPDPEALNRFESACLNPRFKTAYDSAIKKFRKTDSGQQGSVTLTTASTNQIALLSRSLGLNPKDL